MFGCASKLAERLTKVW